MKTCIIFFFLTVFSLSIMGNLKREIRAVWITTNYGLDWPAKPLTNDADIDRQKNELNILLDQLKEAHINMIFFQTRIRGDVIYPSAIEPYSSHVRSNSYRGEGYDMLSYAVKACHERGIECHAWFVTYPLGSKAKKNLPQGLKNKKDLIKTFGNELYLDPGNPETDDYLLSLVAEIVRNYDIDGLHFDYIRYPDRSEKFPDDASYKRYGRNQKKDDWRRANINRFAHAAYDTVKAIKPWVQVSSSVVGMYKKTTEKTAHWTAYYDVYQDPVDWLENGKHDFIVPMMYYPGELFFPFVRDWNSRSNGRFVVPGLGLYQMDKTERNWPIETIAEQLRYCREEATDGNAFYRMKHLTDNKKGILDEVKSQYALPAVLPPLIWLSDTIPALPYSLEVVPDNNRICYRWNALPHSKGMVFYNLYRSTEFPVDIENPNNLIASRLTDSEFNQPLDNSVESGYYYVVTSYDRFHLESEASHPVFFVTGEFEK